METAVTVREGQTSANNDHIAMKKWLPASVVLLGVIFIGVAMLLKNGMPDAEVAITNITSMFMLVAGAICIVGGIVTHFLRHEEDVW